MGKIGVLLVNLGTPDHCDNVSVYRYLTQFLNDPFVIDLPLIIRFILVNVIIVPFRFQQSTKAYQEIWLKEGSPLLVYSKRLASALTLELGKNYQVELGMRYGHPSIAAAANRLQDCERIVALPLFPQYSTAATESAIQAIHRALKKKSFSLIRDFYDAPPFIDSMARHLQAHLQHQTWDCILFSYHGLPERHLQPPICGAPCRSPNPCPAITQDNASCYRAQCYATSRLLAQALRLNENQYATSFQSRLGRTPWIQPYTDLLLPQLVQQGVKHLAVSCPSFVADCLETLEEIGIRLKKQWVDAGGESLTLVPALNDDPVWVENVAKLIRNQLTP